MISRRTHILKYSITPEAEPPYQDDDGNWHYPTPPAPIYIEVKCRIDSNSRGSFSPGGSRKNTEDAATYVYQYLIFLDTVEVDVPMGTEIEAIHMKTGNSTKGEVAFFSRDQRQCRIWV